MMKYSLFAAASFAAILSPAFAQTITVEPGEWAWEVQASLGGAPYNDNGSDCVRPDQASATLQSLLDQLDNECLVTQSATEGTTTTFSVVCNGSVDATADGQLTIEGPMAALSLDGVINTGTSFEPPLTVAAIAERTGTCQG